MSKERNNKNASLCCVSGLGRKSSDFEAIPPVVYEKYPTYNSEFTAQQRANEWSPSSGGSVSPVGGLPQVPLDSPQKPAVSCWGGKSNGRDSKTNVGSTQNNDTLITEGEQTPTNGEKHDAVTSPIKDPYRNSTTTGSKSIKDNEVSEEKIRKSASRKKHRTTAKMEYSSALTTMKTQDFPQTPRSDDGFSPRDGAGFNKEINIVPSLPPSKFEGQEEDGHLSRTVTITTHDMAAPTNDGAMIARDLEQVDRSDKNLQPEPSKSFGLPSNGESTLSSSAKTGPISLPHIGTLVSCDDKTIQSQKTVLRRLRSMVSQSKRRYQKDGFDLDLSYITDRIIAMGFPSIGAEAMYRNPRSELLRLMNQYHSGKWKIYNLCIEKQHQYPKDTFPNQALYAFPDHCPPSLHMIKVFCNDVVQFLEQDPENVIAVHCKAGKGRTGTMICALLLYFMGKKDAINEAMDDFAHRRSLKREGVTIPAQKLAITLFGHCIEGPGRVEKPPSWIADPFIENKVEFSLVKLILGPFKDEKATPLQITTFFGGIKGTVSQLIPKWEDNHMMCLKLKVDLSDPFGHMKIKIQPKEGGGDAHFAELWFFYEALQEAPNDPGLYIFSWPKHHISNLGKSDKDHKFVTEQFRVDGYFEILKS